MINLLFYSIEWEHCISAWKQFGRLQFASHCSGARPTHVRQSVEPTIGRYTIIHRLPQTHTPAIFSSFFLDGIVQHSNQLPRNDFILNSNPAQNEFALRAFFYIFFFIFRSLAQATPAQQHSTAKPSVVRLSELFSVWLVCLYIFLELRAFLLANAYLLVLRQHAQSEKKNDATDKQQPTNKKYPAIFCELNFDKIFATVEKWKRAFPPI